MNKSQRVNLACGGACLLFAAVFMGLTLSIEPGAQVQLVGTKFVPKLLATAIALLSILLIFVTLATGSVRKEFDTPEQANRPAFYGTVLVAFLCLPVWSLIGFLSIPFLIAGTMIVNRGRETFKVIAVSLGATLVMYLVFFQLFELPVPLGLLETFVE